MILLSDVRDWLKTLNAAENYYIGKLDNKKEKSVGVYSRETHGNMQIAIGGLDNTKHAVKRVSLLLHWNKNARETEQAALELQNKILGLDSLNLNGTKVYYIRLLQDEPVDVGTDDDGVYERVIQLDLYYERR